jgi:hypothetical protein
MNAIDLFAAEVTMAKQAKTSQRRAQQRCRLRQARERRPGWVSRQGGSFVHHLGHRLVLLGEWLEASGRPQPSY